jgi:hypothetical protein
LKIDTFLSEDGQIPLPDCIWRSLLHNNPSNGDTEAWLRGMAAQVQRKIAPQMIDALRNTNVAAARLQSSPGQDVGVLDIARGRDAGLPPYNVARSYLGLPVHTDFDTISSDPQVNNIDLLLGYICFFIRDGFWWIYIDSSRSTVII